MVSTNPTETATTVKAGSSQAVTTSGTQNVSFTGLTANTQYYSHFLHRDAAGNDSAVANGPGFTTNASATMAQTYKLTATQSASLTTGTNTFSTSALPDYFVTGPSSQNIRVNVRDAAGNAPLASRIKFVFGVYGQPCPITSFNTNGMPQGVNGTTVSGGHNNGFVTGQSLGGWAPSDTVATNGFYGTVVPSSAFYAWVGTGAGGLSSSASGTAIDMQLWLVYDDNSYKAYDNNTGTPIKFTFTVP
jgi:hypothetical protein